MRIGAGGGSALNIASRDRKTCIEAMDEIKRAIEVAEKIPFKFLVQHIGTGGEEFDEHKFDAAMTSIEHLRAFAKPLGVHILLENIPNELSTPARLVEFIHVTHLPDVGVCFDVGHANMGEGVAASFEPLKPFIRSAHVHDNGGDRDAHLWPGNGKIYWKEAMDLLRQAPQIPPLLIEVEGDLDGSPEFGGRVPELMQEAYRKLEASEADAGDGFALARAPRTTKTFGLSRGVPVFLRVRAMKIEHLGPPTSLSSPPI